MSYYQQSQFPRPSFSSEPPPQQPYPSQYPQPQYYAQPVYGDHQMAEHHQQAPYPHPYYPQPMQGYGPMYQGNDYMPPHEFDHSYNHAMHSPHPYAAVLGQTPQYVQSPTSRPASARSQTYRGHMSASPPLTSTPPPHLQDGQDGYFSKFSSGATELSQQVGELDIRDSASPPPQEHEEQQEQARTPQLHESQGAQQQPQLTTPQPQLQVISNLDTSEARISNVSSGHARVVSPAPPTPTMPEYVGPGGERRRRSTLEEADFGDFSENVRPQQNPPLSPGHSLAEPTRDTSKKSMDSDSAASPIRGTTPSSLRPDSKSENTSTTRSTPPTTGYVAYKPPPSSNVSAYAHDLPPPKSRTAPPHVGFQYNAPGPGYPQQPPLMPPQPGYGTPVRTGSPAGYIQRSYTPPSFAHTSPFIQPPPPMRAVRTSSLPRPQDMMHQHHPEGQQQYFGPSPSNLPMGGGGGGGAPPPPFTNSPPPLSRDSHTPDPSMSSMRPTPPPGWGAGAGAGAPGQSFARAPTPDLVARSPQPPRTPRTPRTPEPRTSNSNSISNDSKPAPFRQYGNIQNEKNPITHEELRALQKAAKKSSGDRKTQYAYGQALLEAASTLVTGRDAKEESKQRAKYVSEAVKIFKSLSNKRFPDAMYALANATAKGGLGLSKDPKQAFKLYECAAKLDHLPSAYRTAVCYELGPSAGTSINPTKAVQWYQRAAALGNASAMYKLGMCHLTGDLGQPRHSGDAVKWLEAAATKADTENPHALHSLAGLYEAGEVVPQDDAKALSLLLQAGKLGYKVSQERLGLVYEHGQLGCQVDLPQAIMWYQLGAAQGDHQCELALSGWYLMGCEGVLAQNDKEAHNLALKAGNAGLPNALYAMGYFNEAGIGCPINLVEAKRWYWKASSLNHPKARARLEELKRGDASTERGKLSRPQNKNDSDCTIM